MGQPLRLEDFEDFMGHPVNPSDLEFMRNVHKFIAGAIIGVMTAALFHVWL